MAVRFVPAGFTLVFALGVQLSGVEIPWLGFSLMGAAFLLLAIPVWYYRHHAPFRFGLRSPITLSQPSDVPMHHQVLIQGRRRDKLVIDKASTPWQVGYPLHFVNTATVPIDVVGYNHILLWNNIPIDRIDWRTPDREANNGISLWSDDNPDLMYTIQPGQPFTLTIPVNRSQVGSLPPGNPIWAARGTVNIRYNGKEIWQTYDFSADSYQLDASDWTEWASQ